MASTYTGDPTATQAPGPQPGPNNLPIMSLPADGDALNAASVAQAFKEAADFIAYVQQDYFTGIFGDGSDGDITLDGSVAAPSGMTKSGSIYYLDRDFFANSIAVTSGATLRIADSSHKTFRLYVRKTLSTASSGTIIASGYPGTNGALATAGDGGAALVAGTVGGSVAGVSGENGGDGTNGVNGNSISTSLGGSGGAGGAGASGTPGTAGTATQITTASLGSPRIWSPGLMGHLIGMSAGVTVFTPILGGASGGSGSTDVAGSSGGSGSGGGIGCIAARNIVLTNATDIIAAGGAGGSAYTGGGNAGGSGGGGGGVIILVYVQKILASGSALTFSAAQNCPGGAAGSGHGTGANGTAGSAGSLFQIGLVG